MIFEDKNFIAKKIRIARKNKGLTQAELAEKIGISAKQLSRIEMASYTPSLFTFLKIIDTLRIDMSEFGIKSPTPENSIKRELLELIYNTTDAEAVFCYNVLNTVINNFQIIKKEKYSS